LDKKAGGKVMNIRILGAHNRESQTACCICFLIDNTLAVDAGGLTSNLSISEQERLSTIILTHQHFDHIRDIPTIALNLSLLGASIEVYATASVCATIKAHLLNGEVYPKFQELPESKPTVIFNDITPYVPQTIDGHEILAIPVNHISTTVGYQISDKQGGAIFYTADTGPGLSNCWEKISPQLLFVDVTMPNVYEEFAKETGHLTPSLLGQELIVFKECKGYLPDVIAVHMDIGLEPKIKEEIAAIAEELDISITVAKEGMELRV
jgi:ribonuclease BN (tRNA processing enzyme)